MGYVGVGGSTRNRGQTPAKKKPTQIIQNNSRFISNKKIPAESPALYDIAPTILSEFDIIDG